MGDDGKEEPYRRLMQARRIISDETDALTKTRVTAMINEIEAELGSEEVKTRTLPRNAHCA